MYDVLRAVAIDSTPPISGALSCQKPTCHSVRGDITDTTLVCFAVEVLNPESIDLALAVCSQVVAEFVAADTRQLEALASESDQLYAQLWS